MGRLKLQKGSISKGSLYGFYKGSILGLFLGDLQGLRV